MQGKQGISRRCYTDDFKAQAVTLASSPGQAQAARKLDMFSHWVEADRQGRRGAGRRVSVSEQESELSWLRAENIIQTVTF
jgi:transposase